MGSSNVNSAVVHSRAVTLEGTRMPQTVKILNWNVQNYGPTKAKLPDIVRSMAQVVVASRPDIFVLLEVNTTNEATAGNICRVLLNALQVASAALGRPNEYRTCVLSPNTGKEFYAYFVRDTAYTTPLVIEEENNQLPENVGSGGWDWEDVGFQKYTNPSVKAKGFPLISPDMRYHGRSAAHWTGTRYPAFGLFYLPYASAANQYLPLIACHFATEDFQSSNQIENLRYFSIINGTSPHATAVWPDAAPEVMWWKVPPPPKPPQIFACNAWRQLNYSIVCGDFNQDFPDSAYNPVIAGNLAPEYTLGGQMANQVTKTHLMTVNDFVQSNTGGWSTQNLATSNYDNFMLFNSPFGGAPFVVNDVNVLDIPAAVASRELTLRESVVHYVELDQRGLTPESALVAYCMDLNVYPPLPMSLQSGLTGARLVSDHLPVLLTITIN